MLQSSPYQPLDPSRQEIRVLWLHPPAQEDDPRRDEIHATLATVSLSQKPAYNALSYTWGAPDDPVHRIWLNGRPFEVRSNLYDCLVHFRDATIQESGVPLWMWIDAICINQDDVGEKNIKESRVPLWIDAVCINQDDVVEKNAQLSLMGDVYRHARSVISWLGSDERLVQGMGLIDEIAREWARLLEELLAVDASAGPELADNKRPPVPRARLEDWLSETRHIWQPEEEDARLSGMVHLFQSNYWRRVWIVQELLLANRETHVYICGTVFITEAQLDILADCVLTVFGGERIKTVSNQVWIELTLGGVRGELAIRAELSAVQLGLVSPSLMFVLYVANTRAATDPRDVVYGLLHLIPDHGIVPDYRKAVWEVYVDWAAKAMLGHGSMELLSYVTTKAERWSNVELDLPSWVPDICNFKGYRHVDWRKREQQQEDGTNGGFAVELLNNGRVLKAEGRRRDTVKKVTRLPRSAEGDPLQWQWDMVRFCMDYVVAHRERGTCYPAGYPPLQALVRLVMQTRIAALSPDEYPKRVHELACEFIAWLVFGFHNMFRAGAPPGEPLELAASLLGLSWGDDFPETYEEAVFPGANVRELMGWNTLMDALTGPDAEITNDYMIDWCEDSWLIETEEGHIGRGPKTIAPGDGIFQLRHCTGTLAFRDSDAASGYVELLGKCDMVGWEDGEAVPGTVEYEQLLIA